MKNKMKEFCELLDIKFEKNFNIKGSKSNPFYINDDGLYDCNGHADLFTLYLLLTGKLFIEKDILTDKEREYLANIIKPDSIYKNVVGIRKDAILGGGYCIKICMDVTKAELSNSIYLPRFKEYKNMYTGMESDRFYTLAELGLEKKDNDNNELNEDEKGMIRGLNRIYPISINSIIKIYNTCNRDYEQTKMILNCL